MARPGGRGGRRHSRRGRRGRRGGGGDPGPGPLLRQGKMIHHFPEKQTWTVSEATYYKGRRGYRHVRYLSYSHDRWIVVRGLNAICIVTDQQNAEFIPDNRRAAVSYLIKAMGRQHTLHRYETVRVALQAWKLLAGYGFCLDRMKAHVVGANRGLEESLTKEEMKALLRN